MKCFDLIIIGGGASGIMAALAAKKSNPNCSVLIVEALNKLGKKILVSGNGRCNILNAGQYAYFGDALFAEQVLQKDAFTQLRAFFLELGLPIVLDEAGRAYPSTFQAETVMEVLQLALHRNGIQVYLEEAIQAIKKVENTFFIHSATNTYQAKKVIVAVGGIASPKHGSNGNLYEQIKCLGFTFTSHKPALCPLLSDMKELRTLAGIRVKANLTIPDVYTCKGEVLFTEYGISGIAGMQMARFCDGKVNLHLDLRPTCNMENFRQEDIAEVLMQRLSSFPQDAAITLLTGLLPSKLAKVILRRSVHGIDQKLFKDIIKNDTIAIAKEIMHFIVHITGLKGYDFAQVSAGGLECQQVNAKTLESKLKGLYFAGEILNVDGDCGGFNLMFAFKSGYLAGIHASK